jgi:hypothetical protein
MKKRAKEIGPKAGAEKKKKKSLTKNVTDIFKGKDLKKPSTVKKLK